MEKNTDYSPESSECQFKASSSRKRKPCFSDEESSTDKSKKIRRGDCNPPSKSKEDSSTGYFVEPESDDECYGGPKAGIGDSAQLHSGDYNPNHCEYQKPAECAALKRRDPFWGCEVQHAQPLIRSEWAGLFKVYSDLSDYEFTCEKFDGLKACVSSNACAEVRSVMRRIPASINWEKVTRASVWPESFERKGGPTDDDIAVFFFPSVTKHESGYESLMFDLIREDAALTAEVMGYKLLLFTSVDLPPLFTRFQGSLYLWGTFRSDRPCPCLS
ncbi:hypothetical protein AAHA92_18756 [Salvia divinorum]|uniref:AIPP2-like SPOC-like domain-containing protein n=1 Tax=Salvia divinorum TaxID=28513 RepID=A0ABD1H350_SALDI